MTLAVDDCGDPVDGLRERLAEAPNVDSRTQSVGVAIAFGLGWAWRSCIIVSLTTEVPFGPEVALVFGGLAGWLSRWKGA